ncbi:hypothetical protein ACFV16_22020 [Streptomyces massasporeus]|uniref:hypothetical protein n=1 Tax=Streptomyces massasporeus TaxID=67324 RepID=UPI0036AC8AEC
MTLQGIPLAYSRLRRLWQLSGDWAVSGNFYVDGALSLAGAALTAQPAEPMPSDHGMVSWPYKPELATSTLAPVSGTVYLTALPVRTAVTVSRLWFLLGAAAVSPVAGQNWAGLLAPNGTLLSTASLDSVITGSNSPKFATLAAPQALSPGMYLGALLFNGSTNPVVYKTASPFLSFASVNQAASAYQYATNGTGRTTLATIDPAVNAAGPSIWMGLSP